MAFVAAAAAVASADPLAIQIDEVCAGLNGDSRVQFVELKFQTPADAQWGPQPGEAASRLQLVFQDAHGDVTATFQFPSDAPIGVIDPDTGGYSCLLATSEFSQLPGAPIPDFLIPAVLVPVAGRVSLSNNPANSNATPLNLCLSYGNYASDTGTDTLGQPAGPPAAQLPITGVSACKRIQNFSNYGTGQFNVDFSVSTPAPRNSAGATGAFVAASIVDQGRSLFLFETFAGNGRSCVTCHRPDQQFGLSPTKISFLSPSDPLFVAETNPALSALENSCLLRSSRGLNLENIDGFANPPMFRAPPVLTNIAFSAPYGHSGEFTNLKQFAVAAVQQHLPKTLARNSDPMAGSLDFRLPTVAEQEAMEAFMLTIKMPADGNFNVTRMIDAAIARGGDAMAIQRGRDLFNGTIGSAKCFKCHSGPIFAASVPALGGGNRAFNTGVSALAINASFPDQCLGGQPMPAESNGNRTFSTPGLIGISHTAPYFHNNAVQTLREAVAFYTGPEFNNSPSAFDPQVGTISLSSQDIDDLTAFLTALDEPFVDCNGDSLDDRVQIAQSGGDCNGNGVLDKCELTDNDCNVNLVPDECDLARVVFGPPASISTTTGGFHVAAADIDGDGHVDLVVPGWTAANVRVLLNDGIGGFTSADPFSVSPFPRALAIADFNGDGRLDVAAPALLSNLVSILLNSGTDEMSNWLGLTGATPVLLNAGPGQQTGPIHVLAVDISGDGWPDLVVCKNFTNQLAVAINLGSDGMGGWNGFGPSTDYPTLGISPWTAAAGDLNGDGRADIIASNRSTDSIAVFLNNGVGGLGAATLNTVQDSPESVILADLNGDQLLDVAVGNADSDTVSVLLGDGAGSFGPQTVLIVGSYPFGAQPHSIVAVDVDRDGDFDLIAANKVSKNISVLLNDGAASFSPPFNLPMDAGPDCSAMADFDGDGRLDIAAIKYADASCVIVTNLTPAFGGDCNGNGIPDACEILEGSELDLNNDTVPDSCQRLGDLNLDGNRDELDLGILVNVLLGLDTDPPHISAADLDGSGDSNGDDIQIFTRIYLGS